jgi:hypothetical protein
MAKQFKPESVAFLIALVVVGILLMAVGAFLAVQGHAFWMNAFLAFGAAVMGAALSLLMARVFEPSAMNEIFHLMSVTKNSPLIADDEKVRSRRLKYHGYLFSHAMGRPQWKYRVFDFTKERRPGYLHARVDVWVPTEPNECKDGAMQPGTDASDTDGEMRNCNQVYLYDGFLCDPYHLLLVGRLDSELGSEPDVIQVFPFGLKSQSNMMFGLAFLETSDNKHVVTPTILSKVRLTNETEFGPVKEPNEEAKLMKLWQQHFLDDFKINVPAEAMHAPGHSAAKEILANATLAVKSGHRSPE